MVQEHLDVIRLEEWDVGFNLIFCNPNDYGNDVQIKI